MRFNELRLQTNKRSTKFAVDQVNFRWLFIINFKFSLPAFFNKTVDKSFHFLIEYSCCESGCPVAIIENHRTPNLE